jgi:hypothetical protein
MTFVVLMLLRFAWRAKVVFAGGAIALIAKRYGLW